MPTTTPKLGLTLPLQDEYYNIAVHNNNYTALDTAIGNIDSGKSDKLTAGNAIVLTPNEQAGEVNVAVSSDAIKQIVDLTPYAKLASPAFTGTPTAPTAAPKDSSTKLATTEFVTSSIINASVASVDNIASGRKITSISGLDVTISNGIDVIGNTVINRLENVITLPARRACLIYDKSDGTSGYVGASFPSEVASTIYRWIVDGSSTVASTVGSNNLVATGSIAQTDGRCGYAALGAGGYYTAQNATNIPAYSAAFAMRIKFKYISNGSAQTFYHDGVRKIGVSSTGYLTIAGVATTFMMSAGEEHLVEIFGAGSVTAGSIYVDGNLTVIGGTVAINAATAAPKVLANTSNGEISVSSVEYIELLNAVTDNPTAGHVANELLFPCFYTNSSVRYNIQEVLLSNTIAIAYALAGSSTISLYNTDDYKYGRREGATGGNRKVFLGWQYFSGAQALKWQNPFGTGKVKREFYWAQNVYGINEIPVVTRFDSDASYGLYPFSYIAGNNDSINITAYSSPGGVTMLNGVWQTSGYIGCYAEVLEDYKGVDGN